MNKYKEIEKVYDYKIPKNTAYMIRLDGKGFSKFTKKHFEKPYDKRLDGIFQNVTEKLMESYKVALAFTTSDEITLLFDKSNDDFYSNRIQKIITIIAGKTSSLFMNELYKNNLMNAAEEIPHFDARLFKVNNLEEVYELFKDRYFSGIRNSKSNLSIFLSKKDRLHKSGNEVINLVKDKYNYYDLPISYRKGVFFIKEKVVKENPYYKEGDKKQSPLVIRNIVKKIYLEKYPDIKEFEKVFNIHLEVRKNKITKLYLKEFFQKNKELLIRDNKLISRQEIFELGKEFVNWYQYLLGKYIKYDLKDLIKEFKLDGKIHYPRKVKIGITKEDINKFIEENKNIILKEDGSIKNISLIKKENEEVGKKIQYLISKNFKLKDYVLEKLKEYGFNGKIENLKKVKTDEQLMQEILDNRDKWFDEKGILLGVEKIKKLYGKKELLEYQKRIDIIKKRHNGYGEIFKKYRLPTRTTKNDYIFKGKKIYNIKKYFS